MFFRSPTRRAARQRAARQRPPHRWRRVVLAASLIALAFALGPARMLLADDETPRLAAEMTASPGGEAQPIEPASKTPVVYCLKIDRMINGIMTAYIKRGLEAAKKAGADLVVIELNTPGGTVAASIEISNLLNSTTLPNVAWANTEATSGGAMVAYACDDIIVSTGGTIGDVIPITIGAGGEIVELPEKIVGYVAQKMRANAEANGHNPDLAEAMVRTSMEIRYDDYAREMEAEGIRLGIPEQYQSDEDRQTSPASVTVGTSHGQPSAEEYGKEYIVKEGQVINFTAREALFLRVAIGRASVIDADTAAPGVERITDIEQFAHLRGARVVTVSRSWSENVCYFLTSPGVVVLLLIGTFVGIGTELKVPGFGFPGILGLTCLALLFFGQMGVGAAKWTDLILLVIGIVLLGVELFVIPGFGFVGVLGIICIVAAVIMMLVENAPPAPERLPIVGAQILGAFLLLGIAIIGSGIGLFLIYYFVLPRTQFLGAVVLTTQQHHATGYHASEGTELAEPEKLVGRTGVAKSKLRPAGRAIFDGEPYDVVTRGDYLEPGTEVEIIEVKANRIVVREKPPPAGPEPGKGT